MQLQHPDPQDAIAAQLRDVASHRAHDPSELNVTPEASPEPASEPSLRATPLNDNTSDIRIPMPHGGQAVASSYWPSAQALPQQLGSLW